MSDQTVQLMFITVLHLPNDPHVHVMTYHESDMDNLIRIESKYGVTEFMTFEYAE